MNKISTLAPLNDVHPQSFSAKGSFIKSKGLRGFSMWEAGGDSNNILVNSIRQSGGF